jgi:hypothetical protein
MSMNRPLSHLELASPWRSQEISWSNTRALLRLTRDGRDDITADVARCVRGRLRHAYPAGAYDVEVVVRGAESADSLADVLKALVSAIMTAEPDCRRIVYAVAAQHPQDASLSAQDLLRAAESAGFRYVTDVDIDGAELKLFVAEPDWVTRADIDLDRIPSA